MRHGILPAGSPATARRWRRNAIALVLAAMTAALLPLLPAPAAHAASSNLALGKAVSVSSANAPYVGTNLNDGDQTATGRAPTAPSRSGRRSTWAPRRRSTRSS